MLLPNGLAGIELFASTVLSGHVIVPLNFRWSIDELADALADCSAKALVIDDHFRDSGVAAAARAQTTLIDGGSRPADGSIIYDSLFGAFSSPSSMSDCGDSDLLTPLEHSREIAAAVVQAQLEVVPGAGHLMTWEQPARVNALLLQWLASVQPALTAPPA